MGIYLRVGYLWFVLVVITLLISKATISGSTLATFSSRVLHERAMGILNGTGPTTLYFVTFATGIAGALPFIIAGGVLGISCRIVIWARSRKRVRASRVVHKVVDRFGIVISMLNAPLDHDPDAGRIQITSEEPKRIYDRTSAIEKDALKLLAMFPDHPADLDGHHGTTLSEHSFATWKLACSRYGAGTLQAQLAICHDLGKIAVYRRNASGEWKPLGSHRAAGLQVIRDLPSFARLPEVERNRLMMMLTALLTKDVPVDISDADRAILRAVNHVDFKTTAEEKREKEIVEAAEDEESLRLDAVSIFELLQPCAETLLRHLNINRSIDANATLHGYYLPDGEVLLVPEQWFRHAMALCLPSEIVEALGLNAKNSKGKHSARDLVVDVAHLLFRTLEVFCDKPATDGTFTIQTHIRTNQDVIAINATELPQTVKDKWGKWTYEIDVSVPKQRKS